MSGSVFDVPGLVAVLLLVVAVVLTAIGIADQALTALLLGVTGFLTTVLADVAGVLALLTLIGGLSRHGGEQGAGGQQGGAQAGYGNSHKDSSVS